MHMLTGLQADVEARDIVIATLQVQGLICLSIFSASRISF